MKYENLDVKTYQMAKGVEKLNRYGFDVFEMYAKENDFSFCDRNRVIAKCKMVHGRTDLKEMSCPDKLKGARWDYYTKTLKYSQDEARIIIGRIDDSYQKQFLPKVDINKLASTATRNA